MVLLSNASADEIRTVTRAAAAHAISLREEGKIGRARKIERAADKVRGDVELFEARVDAILERMNA